MSTIINLVRLQYKVYGDEALSRKNVKSKLGYLIPIGLCVLTMAALLLYAITKIGGYFVEAQLTMEYLQILFLAVQVIQFALGISTVSKTLFGSENDDLLKLPVSGIEIFSAKIIYLYLHELVFSTAVILPTLVVFGAVFHQPVLFFLTIIPVCLLFPVFPFSLALIVSVPVMLMRKFLKNKFLVILLSSICSISVSYVAYMYALEIVLNLVFFNTAQITFTEAVIEKIIGSSRFLIPQSLLTNLLCGQDALLSVALLLLSSFVIIFAVLFFADKWYYTAFFKEAENNNVLRRKKSRIAKGGVFAQLVNREFVNIFRSVNYSFQFLALAASTPIMVYFCSRLALGIGIGNVGQLILPGLVIMIVVMFIALSSSFSASAVTREGNKLFHMKNIPAPAKVQITAKVFVYALVSSLSVLISSICLLIGKYVDIKVFFVITFTCVFVSLGGICNSVKRDLKNPAFKDLGTGEMVVTNNNTMLSIAVGLLTSLVLGGAVIAMCFAELAEAALWTVMGAGILFAALSVFRLYFRLDKTFDRIEP